MYGAFYPYCWRPELVNNINRAKKLAIAVLDEVYEGKKLINTFDELRMNGFAVGQGCFGKPLQHYAIALICDTTDRSTSSRRA